MALGGPVEAEAPEAGNPRGLVPAVADARDLAGALALDGQGRRGSGPGHRLPQ